jgi:hypothetical protein
VDAEIIPFGLLYLDVHKHLLGQLLVRADTSFVALAVDSIIDVPVLTQLSIWIPPSKDAHIVPPSYRPARSRSTQSRLVAHLTPCPRALAMTIDVVVDASTSAVS